MEGMDDKLLSIGEASNTLGVSIDTLRRWEKQGKIPTFRSPGGHRYYKTADLKAAMNKKYQRAPQSASILNPVPPITSPINQTLTTEPGGNNNTQDVIPSSGTQFVKPVTSMDKQNTQTLPSKPQKLKDLLTEEKPKIAVDKTYEMSSSTFLAIALVMFSLIDVILIYFLINMG